MEYLVKPAHPCRKDCPYRDACCKIDCPEYKEYEEKYQQYNIALNKKRKIDEALIQHKKQVFAKNRKSRRR